MPSGLKVTLAAEEVVQGVAVEMVRGGDGDQALVAVGDVDVAIERVDLASRGSPGDGCGSGRERSVVGAATARAYVVRTKNRCPIGETGAVTIRSEKPLWSMNAMSKTRSPFSPQAA